MCVAWALSYTAIAEPLVIFSCGNLLYIYNIRRKGISSYLRGHGGVRISASGVDSWKIRISTQSRLLHRYPFTHQRQTCSVQLLEIIPQEFMIWRGNLKHNHQILTGRPGNIKAWLAQRMASICMNLRAKVLVGVCLYWWVDDQVGIRLLF